MSTTGYQEHCKSLKKSVGKTPAPSPAPSSTSAFWLQTSAFGRQQSAQIDCLGTVEVWGDLNAALVLQRFRAEKDANSATAEVCSREVTFASARRHAQNTYP
jgi:hypothetical protein